MRIRTTILFSIMFFTLSLASSLADGVIDLTRNDFGNRPVTVVGDANLYWEQFLTLQELETLPPSAQMKIPGIWNKIEVNSKAIPATGFATISFRITAPDSIKNQLAISIPSIFSSYRLYVDSVKIAHCGEPHQRLEASITDIAPQVVEFEITRDTAVLYFHISNYTNDKGGPWQPMILGERKAIHRIHETHFAYDIFLIGGLLAFSLAYFFSFLIMKHGVAKEVSLYFALFCFMTLIRLLVTSKQTLYHIFPDIPTSIFVHLEFLASFLSPLFYHSYIHTLYKPFSHNKVLSFYRYFFLFLTGFSLLTPLLIHSRTIPIFQAGIIILSLYHFYLGLVSYKTEKIKALLLLISTMILFIGVIHDVLQTYSIGQSLPLIPLSSVIVAMLQAYIVSRNSQTITQERDHYSSKLEVINGTLSKFVPNQFFSILDCTPTTIKLGDQKKCKMCVMFIDIRNLQQLSENLSSKEQFDLISTFLDYVTTIITAHGGVIDKFIGDSAMAIFPEKPKSALLASYEILNNFYAGTTFNETIKSVLPGIGIHYGPMTLGVIGNADRMENTVIGDAVNTAARMKSLTHLFNTDLIVSNDVLQDGILENDLFHIRSLGTLAVKGKRERTTIQEIFYVPLNMKAPKLLARGEFEQAIVFFEYGHYDEARNLFREALKINPNDAATSAFIDSCEHSGKSLLKSK